MRRENVVSVKCDTPFVSGDSNSHVRKYKIAVLYMKLKELKQAIDRAVEYAGELNPNVEVWYKKKMYRIQSIGQFHLVPDVTITIGEKVLDLGDD
jgi:hypothetical protein